jgi:hypothetical protein
MNRLVLASVISIAVVAVTAYFSARVGYREGLADAPGSVESPDAAYIVTILDRLKAGDTAQAVALLETNLDKCLVDRWAYDRRGHRFLAILRPAEITAIPALVGIGAQYRAKNPSTMTSAKATAAIAEVVAKYAPLAPTQRLPN